MLSRQTPKSFRPLIPLGAALLLLTGCAGSATPGDSPRSRGMERTERYVGPRPEASADTVDDRAALYVDGRPVSRTDVWVRLLEASGERIIDEIALDAVVEAACRDADIAITADDIAREEALFIETLTDTGVSVDEETARRMLGEVRVERGLGKVRYASMLRRSAMLRRLVADQVNVTDATARLAYDLRYGPRRQVRLITTATARDAQQVATRLRAGDPFEIVASEASTDISASRGGLLEPVHLDDTSYPAAVRRVLAEMEVGEVSAPIALEQGFAIVKVIGEIGPEAAAPAFSLVEDAMRREARLVQERLLMAQLARELWESADIRIEIAGLALER